MRRTEALSFSTMQGYVQTDIETEILALVQVYFVTDCTMTHQGFDLYRHFDRILMKRVAKMSLVVPLIFRSCHVITGSGQSVVSLILPIMKQM